ncbi:MAG: hypothetical protein ACYSWU_27840 [Planctomycetota bacterium]|jgi:hypothetical protein
MRQTVYYVIIGIGVLTGIVVLAVWLWPEDRPDPPEVLQDRILNSPSVKERAAAAREMVYHGPAARPQVNRVLDQYKGNEPEVMVPLLQASMKTGAWQSLPKLFKLMEHPDPRIRGKAGAAASKIMGADYYFRADDPPQERAKVLARMKDIYEQMKPRLNEYYESPKQQ